MRSLLKALLPNHALALPILRGPFRGAIIRLNPRHSLRKVFGVYEHELNRWLKRAVQTVKVVYDVGANDGYFTYGCAQALRRYNKKGHVIAFEPLLADESFQTLRLGGSQNHYSGITFEFIPLFVGSATDEMTTTLDRIHMDRPGLRDQPTLIKVDVEGAEVEVLKGAKELLKEPHQWVVEVHGSQLMAPVLDSFRQAGRAVSIYEPKPHWLLGPELRGECSWVVTD